MGANQFSIGVDMVASGINCTLSQYFRNFLHLRKKYIQFRNDWNFVHPEGADNPRQGWLTGETAPIHGFDVHAIFWEL